MPLPNLGLQAHLEALLTGKVTPQEADPRILKWAELFIYQGACDVLRLPSQDDRRKALDKIPATIRPYVEREAKRLWTERKGRGKPH